MQRYLTLAHTRKYCFSNYIIFIKKEEKIYSKGLAVYLFFDLNIPDRIDETIIKG
jgi:hypothetical protein